MEAWIESLLVALALPKFGLSTVFVVSLISATLLPMGSEPVVFGTGVRGFATSTLPAARRTPVNGSAFVRSAESSPPIDCLRMPGSVHD